MAAGKGDAEAVRMAAGLVLDEETVGVSVRPGEDVWRHHVLQADSSRLPPAYDEVAAEHGLAVRRPG